MDGAVINPPAPRPLDRFAVTIENGIVKVDTSTPIQRDHSSTADWVYTEVQS
jgi:cytochrome b6-f complex iron-sulfur subunit